MELQQFCILARTQKGRACAALVQQVLAHRKIYVFCDLLDVPSVQALKDSEFSKAYKTLELFAYGTVKDYYDNTQEYLELGEVPLSKLRQLTLLTLCGKEKNITYDTLFQALVLEKEKIRELEDLIIDSINSNLLTGKLNPQKQYLIVSSCIARDVSITEIPLMIHILKEWRERCHSMTQLLEEANGAVAAGRMQDEQEQVEVQRLVEMQKQLVKQQMEAGEYEDSPEEMAFGPGGGGLGGMKRPLRSMFGSGHSHSGHMNTGRANRF